MRKGGIHHSGDKDRQTTRCWTVMTESDFACNTVENKHLSSWWKRNGSNRALTSSWVRLNYHGTIFSLKLLPILPILPQCYTAVLESTESTVPFDESATWLRDPLVCQRGTLSAVLPRAEESEKCEKPSPYREPINIINPLIKHPPFGVSYWVCWRSDWTQVEFTAEWFAKVATWHSWSSSWRCSKLQISRASKVVSCQVLSLYTLVTLVLWHSYMADFCHPYGSQVFYPREDPADRSSGSHQDHQDHQTITGWLVGWLVVVGCSWLVSGWEDGKRWPV